MKSYSSRSPRSHEKIKSIFRRDKQTEKYVNDESEFFM